MTRKVHSIRADKKLVAARAIMDWAGMSSVPVTDLRGCFVGMVTKDTILAASPSTRDRSIPRAENDQRLASVLVGDSMVRDLPAVSPDGRAWLAAHLMAEHRVACLAVVDGERLVGLVTESDLLAIVAHYDDDKTHVPGLQSSAA
ncbi:MAG: CBS domain-containing protein [Gemmatimonadaceae bacterium]